MNHIVLHWIQIIIYIVEENNVGQCAKNISIEDIVSVPTRLKYFHTLNKKIINIKTGNNHGTVAITENEEYYIWGCNCNNECCINDFNQNKKYIKLARRKWVV